MDTRRKAYKIKRVMRFLITCLVVAGLSRVALAETWSASQNLSNGTGWATQVGPALVSFNGKLYAVVKGTDSKIYVFSSNDGTNWGGLYAIPGETTTHRPAVTVFNNKIYCIFKAISSNQIVVISSSDGANWSSAYFMPGQTSPFTTAIAAFNNKLYCIQKANSSNKIVVISSSDGSNWGTAYYIPNALTPTAPAVAVFNNKLYCVVKGDGNNNIYVMSSTDGANWSGASTIPTARTPIGPALAVFNNKLYCLHQGDGDNGIWIANSSDGANWSATYSIPNQYTTHTPATAVFNNKLYCLYKGNGNANIYLTDAAGSVLDVQLYAQQTDMWCWAASGEMIMNFLGNNVSQCTQANNYHNRNDCCDNFENCDDGGWPEFDNYGFDFLSTNWGNALSYNQLKTEFENNRPVGFAWSWQGGGGHYMVAHGVFEDAEGERFVHINDPAPWNANKMNGGDGRLITYDEFVASPGAYSTWINDYNIVNMNN